MLSWFFADFPKNLGIHELTLDYLRIQTEFAPANFTLMGSPMNFSQVICLNKRCRIWPIPE